MSWLYLFLAGILEIGWAIGLKYVQGLSRPLPLILTVTCLVSSLILLAMALKTLPIGTAYAVWTGIGTLGTLVLGIILFGESMEPMRLVCAGLIVSGIIGLKVLT
jgi:quaternary ammonium compound-resistance protein SugE